MFPMIQTMHISFAHQYTWSSERPWCQKWCLLSQVDCLRMVIGVSAEKGGLCTHGQLSKRKKTRGQTNGWSAQTGGRFKLVALTGLTVGLCLSPHSHNPPKFV